MSPDEAKAMLVICRDTTARMKDMIDSDKIDQWSEEALRGFLRGLVRAYELRVQLERVDVSQECLDAYKGLNRPEEKPQRPSLQVIDGGKS